MKKAIVTTIMTILATIIILALSGCWNYKEIESMGIVAGLAIDKTSEGKFLLTVELTDIKGGTEAKVSSKIVSITGETLFDAIRNSISVSGKRIFWSHSKVLVFSQEIIREDIIKTIDWINRDAETRDDMNVLISMEKTAKEILEVKGVSEEVISFNIEDIIKSQESLSKSPQILMSDFITAIAGKGVAPIAPAIYLDKSEEKPKIQVMGAALFNDYGLVGFLDGNDTKTLLFVIDKIKGGLLVQEEEGNEGVTKIAFEIFKNATKLKPSFKNGSLEMNIGIKTTVAIDEIMGREDYTQKEKMITLEKNTEAKMNTQIEQLIKKVQIEYGSDIFGFGAKIREDLPKQWKSVESDWTGEFKNLKVSVNTDIQIKNTANLSQTLEFGE